MVRHPSYTGVLLAFVGLALSLGNWAALLVILLPIGVAFIHRMNVRRMPWRARLARNTPITCGALNG
jgi:protein-S-isoprenylcysteine O-methyltransferase Ste14